jgi:hypothetical protein
MRTEMHPFANPLANFAIPSRKTAPHAAQRIALRAGDIFSTGSGRFRKRPNAGH